MANPESVSVETAKEAVKKLHNGAYLCDNGAGRFWIQILEEVPYPHMKHLSLGFYNADEAWFDAYSRIATPPAVEGETASHPSVPVGDAGLSLLDEALACIAAAYSYAESGYPTDCEETLERFIAKSAPSVPVEGETVCGTCGKMEQSHRNGLCFSDTDPMTSPKFVAARPAEEREGDFPITAHEWLADALGRYQVTHCHSAIRQALKAMDQVDVSDSHPSVPVGDAELPQLTGKLSLPERKKLVEYEKNYDDYEDSFLEISIVLIERERQLLEALTKLAALQSLLGGDGWVKVEDRLPEINEYVWVFTGNSSAPQITLSKCAFLSGITRYWSNLYTSHWQPMNRPTAPPIPVEQPKGAV
jgi:hypothetical protein